MIFPVKSCPEATLSKEEQLDYAREILRAEAESLNLVADRLSSSFTQIVQLLLNCNGRIGITGTGKSADVGQKIAGTLNSTGTRAYHFDATRAMHGDLGMIAPDDVVLILSHSGESEEIVRLLVPLQDIGCPLIAMTGNPQSTLARNASATLAYGPLEETCPLGLAPSASTTTMIALGDALAFVLIRLRQFSQEDFARFHPAGSLGRKLLPVTAVMRKDHELRVSSKHETVREVFAQVRHQGRRTGAVILIDELGKLCGLFTDSDLARLIEQRQDTALDRPIAEVMTKNPIQISKDAQLSQAAELLQAHKISELPVVDENHQPVGLIDITDLMGLVSEEEIRTAA